MKDKRKQSELNAFSLLGLATVSGTPEQIQAAMKAVVATQVSCGTDESLTPANCLHEFQSEMTDACGLKSITCDDCHTEVTP